MLAGPDTGNFIVLFKTPQAANLAAHSTVYPDTGEGEPFKVQPAPSPEDVLWPVRSQTGGGGGGRVCFEGGCGWLTRQLQAHRSRRCGSYCPGNTASQADCYPLGSASLHVTVAACTLFSFCSPCGRPLPTGAPCWAS